MSDKKTSAQNRTSLAGQILIAMPNMQDPRFARALIYMCVHNEEGAMGLVINRLVGSLNFTDLMEQLGVEKPAYNQGKKIYFGGPVESGRGFVLHTDDYKQDGTLVVADGIALTATVDILREISSSRGPEKSIISLGYAGWGPGQLDMEIQANGWLHVPADKDLVFNPNLENKWELAMAKLGVDIRMLSGTAGHA